MHVLSRANTELETFRIMSEEVIHLAILQTSGYSVRTEVISETDDYIKTVLKEGRQYNRSIACLMSRE